MPEEEKKEGKPEEKPKPEAKPEEKPPEEPKEEVKVEKPEKPKEEKPKKKSHQKNKFTLYEVSGETLNRKNKPCPRCGPGIFLAKHQGRVSCGKCGYTEFLKKQE